MNLSTWFRLNLKCWCQAFQTEAHGNIFPLSTSESEKKLSEGVSQTKTRTLFEGLDYSERECATSVSDYTAWTANVYCFLSPSIHSCDSLSKGWLLGSVAMATSDHMMVTQPYFSLPLPLKHVLPFCTAVKEPLTPYHPYKTQLITGLVFLPAVHHFWCVTWLVNT